MIIIITLGTGYELGCLFPTISLILILLLGTLQLEGLYGTLQDVAERAAQEAINMETFQQMLR